LDNATAALALPATTGPGLPDILNVVGSLALLLGVLYAGFWLLRRFGPRAVFGGPRGSALKLEGQLALGPRRSLVVVRFLNKRLVLGVTDQSITLLHEAEDEPDRDGTQSFEKAMDAAGSPGDGKP